MKRTKSVLVLLLAVIMLLGAAPHCFAEENPSTPEAEESETVLMQPETEERRSEFESYAECVAERAGNGFAFMGEAIVTPLAVPLACLAIPVIGPFLSVGMFAAVPVVAIGALLYGLAQVVASPVMGYMDYR